MMKRRTYILLLAVLTLALSSCESRESNFVSEGKPATISLKIERVDADIIETKGMTVPQERDIERVYIMIFNSSGLRVASQKFTSISPTLTMDAISGNNMQIYAIANYSTASTALGNPGIESALDAVGTVDELRSVVSVVDGISPTNPGHLMMVGNETMKIKPNSNNSANIQLYYTTAKITVKFIDNTADQGVSFFGWSLHNLPRKGYLIGGDNDAVNPADNSDFFDVEGTNLWEIDEALSGYQTVSESFYMYESRRGISSQTYTNGYKDKTLYAPANAAYLLASLSCTNNGATYDIKMRVYLGENNTNDYNVMRSKHYTYTVTISGVNSITVDVATDSNTDALVFPLEITTSSTLTFDSHPDQRMIKINADGDDVQNVSIEVVGQAPWLKISPLNLMRHQVRQNGNIWQQDGADGSFVRGRYIPHRSNRGTGYTPPNGVTLTAGGADNGVNGLNLPDIDDELPFSQATYRMCYKITDIEFNTDGTDTYEFSIYSDEYGYMDGLSSRSATIKISYEDKRDNNTPKSIEYNVSQRQPMPVGGVVVAYDGTNTTHKYAVVEQIEESAIAIEPGLPSDFQQTMNMQWGDRNFQAFIWNNNLPRFDNYRNGYFQTVNEVYGAGTSPWSATGNYVTRNVDGSNVGWFGLENTYRPKYGSKHYNTGSNGKITEPTALGNTGSPYYYPTRSNTPSANNYYQSVYNSSAARYCHEKNRDANGDGKLEPSETKWFLPSQHDLYQIWVSLEAIRYSTTEFGRGYYWSSSESGAGSAYVIGFQTGFTSNSGRDKSKIELTDGVYNDVSRCMRVIDTPFNTQRIGGDRIIDCSDMPNDAITRITKGSAASGMIDNAGISEIGSSVYYKFQVAREDAGVTDLKVEGTMNWSTAIGYGIGISEKYSGDYPADHKLGNPSGTHKKVSPNSTFMRGAPANHETGCAAYWEGSKTDANTGIGKWRLPNKRELMLMWIYRGQLESFQGFDAFNTLSDYWSASERANNTAHGLKFENGLCSNEGKTNLKYARCIREIP